MEQLIITILREKLPSLFYSGVEQADIVTLGEHWTIAFLKRFGPAAAMGVAGVVQWYLDGLVVTYQVNKVKIYFYINYGN